MVWYTVVTQCEAQKPEQDRTDLPTQNNRNENVFSSGAQRLENARPSDLL